MTFPRRTLPALALGLLLAACGEDASSTTPTITDATTPTPSGTAEATVTASPAATASADGDATPEGWQRLAVAERGFSLAVPDDWQELSPDVIGDSGVMEQMLESNPDAAAVLEQAQAAIESGQIALFAFDASDEAAEGGFATNLNAINVGPVEESAEEAAEQVADAIRDQVPVTGEVETETASLPAGDAAVIRYEWELDDGTGTTTAIAVTQYAIIGGRSGTGFILSMSAASDDVERHEETFRQIAESFREEGAEL